MTTWIGLLRGINVGKAKRLAMADLRRLVEEAGYSDARTLLNSGNVVFRGQAGAPAGVAARLEQGIERVAGFHADVVAITAATLATIVEQNVLAARADDHARLLVAFVQDGARLDVLRPIAARDWGEEAMAVGSHAAYVWSPRGVLESSALDAVGRALTAPVTTRNWATVQKLATLAGASS